VVVADACLRCLRASGMACMPSPPAGICLSSLGLARRRAHRPSGLVLVHGAMQGPRAPVRARRPGGDRSGRRRAGGGESCPIKSISRSITSVFRVIARTATASESVWERNRQAPRRNHCGTGPWNVSYGEARARSAAPKYRSNRPAKKIPE
jgi:hypothetical protein